MNRRVLVSFPTGMSGRFIATIFSYLLSSTRLDTSLNLTTGSTHNCPFPYFVGDDDIHVFKSLLHKHQLLDLSITATPGKEPTMRYLNFQYGRENSNIAEIKTELLTKLKQISESVIVTHIINNEILDDFISDDVTSSTVVQIVPATEEDRLYGLILVYLKCGIAGAFDRDNPEIFFNEFSKIYPFLDRPELKDVQKATSPVGNVIQFPFSKIREKDVEYIVSFIKETAVNKLAIEVNSQQTDEIRQFAIKYFSIQPDISTLMQRIKEIDDRLQ